MPTDPPSSQRGLEKQKRQQGINTATAETDFTVLCLALRRQSANPFCFFPKFNAERSCALSKQAIIAGQLSVSRMWTKNRYSHCPD